MSDQRFKWNLTPTERRIAESIVAITLEKGGAEHQAIRRARNAIFEWRMESVGDRPGANDALRAELRSEPNTIRNEGMLTVTVERALLERVVGQGLGVLELAAEVERLRADGAGNRLGMALDIFGGTIADARKELAR